MPAAVRTWVQTNVSAAVRRSPISAGTNAVRNARRFVARVPGSGLVFTAPRTARFVAGSWTRSRLPPDVERAPAPRPSLALVASVAMDEAVLAVMKRPSRLPHRDDYPVVAAELRAARDFYAESGFLADPASYHRAPPPLVAPVLLPARLRSLRYERLAFVSEFEPWASEPARDRWLGYEPNRIAQAWVVRHRDGDPDRPWIVCLHGFGMGSAWMDLPAFRAVRLHRELGANLVFPVLPLHGDRRIGGVSGEAMMSYQLLNGVHGLTQAMWDVRRVMAWVWAQGATRVGVYGVSLGGYVAALLAALEDGIDAVIAGIPICDLPALFRYHMPPNLRPRAERAEMIGAITDEVFSVVSPLSFAPRVPRDRRFVFAGLADRMATPHQAFALWRHWEQPEVAWYGGNHVGYLWSRSVDTFVLAALRGSGLTAR